MTSVAKHHNCGWSVGSRRKGCIPREKDAKQIPPRIG